MRLTYFTVRGFRSLADVSDVPVSSPTILAGHNDGGKSALLTALSYLLGAYDLVNDDRTYWSTEDDGDDVDGRCAVTEVDGTFEPDTWERKQWSLPEKVRIRRLSDDGGVTSRWELWRSSPDDPRLRDLTSPTAAELKKLAQELGIKPVPTTRAKAVSALLHYANENSTGEGWGPLPGDIRTRLPLVLSFDGKAKKPDEAIRSALMGKFKAYTEDESIQGRLQEIENTIQDQLRNDAKSLCDHIRQRCPDLAEIFVDPEVSFTQGFRGAPLRIARTSGEAVSLERSGLGSAQRISLAIWEWTSELLSDAEAAEGQILDDSTVTVAPPTQTIIVYDEPDTHLDYAQQRKIMRLIRDQSKLRHVDVIVATHSMNLIDGVDISDVVHLRLNNGRTVAERLHDDAHKYVNTHLSAISAAVGIRNSVLLHERCFLAVEGETEQQSFPLLFKLSQGMSLQSAGIALWACNNNEGALHLARYLVEHNRTVALVVDADSQNHKFFKRDRLVALFGENVNDMLKLLGQAEGINEFEELFPDELWSRVANRIWPCSTGWNSSDFAKLRSSGKFSEKVLERLRQQSDKAPSGKPEMMQTACRRADRSFRYTRPTARHLHSASSNGRLA